MMTEVEVIPELKQIIGALLFAAKTPMGLKEITRVVKETGGVYGGYAKDFAAVADADVESALTVLRQELENHKLGVHVTEIAGGYRLQNDSSCGPWLRFMLEKGRGHRLSKPALETMAIIAYRQPCTRAEIEAVRGVAVDQILRNLLDMQLVRIAGRSDLPGKPWLFGTTQKFLEYFGLKDVKDLPGIEELRRMEAERLQKKDETPAEKTLEESESTTTSSENADREEAMNSGRDMDEEEDKDEVEEEDDEFEDEDEEEEDDEEDDEDDEDEE